MLPVTAFDSWHGEHVSHKESRRLPGTCHPEILEIYTDCIDLMCGYVVWSVYIAWLWLGGIIVVTPCGKLRYKIRLKKHSSVLLLSTLMGPSQQLLSFLLKAWPQAAGWTSDDAILLLWLLLGGQVDVFCRSQVDVCCQLFGLSHTMLFCSKVQMGMRASHMQRETVITARQPQIE